VLAELAEFLALLVDLLARVLPSLEDGFGALEAVLRPRRVVGFGLNLVLRLRLGGLLGRLRVVRRFGGREFEQRVWL
jgi:hypothetical protein